MSIEGHSLIIGKEKGYALYEVCMIKKICVDREDFYDL